MELFPGYCIDTNALIDLWRRFYPPDVFPSLWKNLENLISDRRLVAPREVFKELENLDDELLKWARNHRGMFEDLDYQQVDQVKDILRRFPRLVDENKIIPDADPFVIALARSKGWTVITSENPGNPGGPPRIPDVCKEYEVRCIKLLEFFREQKWKL